MKEMETYYCSHCEPGSDDYMEQHFQCWIGSARRLVLCEQCYRAIGYLVIVDLVQEAGAVVARHLGSSRLWMDGRFMGTRDEDDRR